MLTVEFQTSTSRCNNSLQLHDVSIRKVLLMYILHDAYRSSVG